MNSKQLVFSAIHNKETERVPWVPFVGCHAANLIGVSAKDYFKSSDNIVKGVKKAFELYKPDGLPVIFDLQVEAEAMGCELVYADENPPSVATHPLEEGKTLEDLKIPGEEDGRFPIVLEAAREICKTLGDKIAIYGLVTGPFTLALHLRGTSIFYDMIDDEEKVHQLMKFTQRVCQNSARMYMEAGVDIVAVVDPMTSQISPDHFAKFVSPYVKPVFEYIKSRGKASSLFVCGNAKNNLEEMCKCYPDNISIDENVPLDFARELCTKYGISLGGNIKLTVTMLLGDPIDNINGAKNCMQIGGKKGYILSPGCDMPYNTPVDNVKAITSVVHGEEVEFMEVKSHVEDIKVDLPDYTNSDKVIVEVFTLDSQSCAPCQYMVAAAESAVSGLEDKVKFTEYKIKEKESIVRMSKLGVKNIPTICINGKIKYVSIIPAVDELRKAIEDEIAIHFS
ncbi:MAG: uroporphyrinogen decarboxylase [Thermoanaerobacteraceae bacterium]|nr:uroporphyrinogen decarboxylase [Thermoanaerobacteraceae bacterium]